MKNPNNVTVGRNGLRTRSRLMLFVFSSLLLALGSLLSAQSSEAKVTGNCSNCHTMHNSQNGQCQAKVYSDGSLSSTCTPQGFLLKGDCLGCHGQGTSSNIIGNGIIPQVLHSNSTDLAGGNFAYITGMGGKSRTGADQNTAGHNVVDLGSSFKDTVLTAPPGDQHSTGITNNNFTCAGQYGCHGDRTVTVGGVNNGLLSIKGAHHTDDTVLKFGSINIGAQGGSTGLSYRFLKGVLGGEDSDWESTLSSTDHNEYFGATSMGPSNATAPANGTISGLCAECHGNYHGDATDVSGRSDIGTQSPWFRHPTDISLLSSGEYLGYTAYSTIVPVARTTIPSSPSATVTPTGTTDDIVMCLSCHRAHASPYFKMMRWDYKGWPASGGTNGCNVCHTSKN